MAYRDQLQEEIERLALALTALFGKLNAKSVDQIERDFEQEFGLSLQKMLEMDADEIDDVLDTPALNAQNTESLIELIIGISSMNREKQRELAQLCLHLINSLNKREDTISWTRIEIASKASELLNPK